MLRCVFSWEGEWSVTVSMSVWKGRAKLICVWTGWCVCVCVYAVTLPLIQLSKLLSDAGDWQGFHSTVLDTNTQLFVCPRMYAQKCFLCFIHRASLSFCSFASALGMISARVKFALIDAGLNTATNIQAWFNFLWWRTSELFLKFWLSQEKLWGSVASAGSTDNDTKARSSWINLNNVYEFVKYSMCRVF